ncbi:DUF2812 domain-containing protein [Clostridium sp.]|jgi:hypothetical protein|uniref:DUF2812 domain-containing protein n=1 Tax=Clostridium sp. TaxID=1506 RepID=UPI003EED6B8A
MWSKDRKTTLFMYLPYECSALEEYLEKMAQKGWILKSTKRGFFKFRKIEIRKIEIRKIKYSVDVLDSVSVFDHIDSDTALEYREYCEAVGWKYICEDGKIQIFYTEGDKEIISIHTDEEEKFNVVFKSSIKDVYAQMLLILFFIYSIYRQLTNNTELSLATNIGVCSLVLLLAVILMSIIGIVNFFIWVIKAKRHLKKNKLMPFNSYKQLRRKNILMIAYNLIVFIILLVAIFDIPASSKPYIPIVLIVFIPAISISCIKKYINRKKYSRDANIGIYIGIMIISLVVVNILGYVVLSHVDFDTITNTNIKQSEVPTEKASLTFADFGYEKNGDKNLDIKFDKSIIAQRTFYRCNNGDSWLRYTVFESKYPWLIKLDENGITSINRLNNNNIHYSENIKLENTNLPANIRVYSGGSLKNHFVLVSEYKVIDLRINSNEIREDELLNMAYKKLFTQ